MTRRKRRRIKGAARCFAAVMLPVMVASAAKGTVYVKRAVKGADRLLLSSTDSAEAPHISTDSEIVSRIIREDELLGGVVLSEGYGAEDESGNSELLRLPSPLDMEADDAGEKPYPQVWNTDGEIVRAFILSRQP